MFLLLLEKINHGIGSKFRMQKRGVSARNQIDGGIILPIPDTREAVAKVFHTGITGKYFCIGCGNKIFFSLVIIEVFIVSSIINTNAYVGVCQCMVLKYQPVGFFIYCA